MGRSMACRTAAPAKTSGRTRARRGILRRALSDRAPPDQRIDADPHADPPEGSPYEGLPADLRATLETSFADRLAGLPGAGSNLLFGFPAPLAPPPRTI